MASIENHENLEKAQAAVRQKMAEREQLSQDYKECMEALAKAEANLQNAQQDYDDVKSVLDNKDRYESAKSLIEEKQVRVAQLEKQRKHALQDWNETEQARKANKVFGPYQSDVDKAQAEYSRIMNLESQERQILEQAQATVNELDEKMKDDHIQSLVNQAEEVKNNFENAQNEFNSTQEECQKLKDELDKSKDFDEETLKKMEEVPPGRSRVDSIASHRTGRNKSDVWGKKEQFNDNDLIDLRNVNNKNFRGWAPDVKKAYALVDTQLAPSRTFYMNQNYLFADSLANPGYDFKKFKSTPEIQPLILNEFQPYDMLSVADLLPGAADAVGGMVVDVGTKMLGNTIVNTGKNALMNKMIDTYSEDPSQLYKTSHIREYFTKDPVTQVRNMFNGRNLVEHI